MKLAICTPYWREDRAKALSLLNFIADIEPRFRDDVIVCPVNRFDEPPLSDDELAKVREKFPVFAFQSITNGTGWPDGPNAQFIDIANMAARRWYEGFWQDVGAFHLMEPDVVPLSRSWIDQLKFEWICATKENPEVIIVGSWRNSGGQYGHINGNATYHTLFSRRVDLTQIPHGLAYDAALADQLRRRWKISGLYLNHFRVPSVNDRMLTTPETGERRPILVHGVQDASAMDYARKVLL